MSKITNLINHLKISLKKYNFEIYENKQNIYIECKKIDLTEIVKFIKNDDKCLFSQLTDITAVDYINNEKRFEIIYIFLSFKYNIRLIIKVSLAENETILSICDIFKSANWYERECYDLFGIIFDSHPDLRRIMTDYNFVGHPLRKDFPLTGHNEVRYDNLQKKVVYEPVKLQQEYRNFDYASPWEGISTELNNNEEISENKDGTE